MGLVTIATSSTRFDAAPSSWPAARNAWAISGQSVVHTGSRKVSSTTLPRRLARLTVWPCWSVRAKPLAGKFSGAADPAMDSARIGSAFRLAWAAAIGAAPRMISPSAPTEATVPKLAAATERLMEAGRNAPRQGDAGAGVGTAGPAGAAAL